MRKPLPSLSLCRRWLLGRPIRWQLVASMAIVHTLIMTAFVIGLLRWQQHVLVNPSHLQSDTVGLASDHSIPKNADDHAAENVWGRRDQIVLAALLYAIVSAGVGSLLAWAVASAILKPLRLLQDGIARFGIDRLDQPIPIIGANEVATICAAFNAAMARLALQQNLLRIEMQERASSQREAEESNQAKDHFLAILSHELRTPLTPMLTLAQMLERDPTLDPAVREDIVTIRRNVELEARLIDDLLDLTRIRRGKVELQLVTVDVHERLREVVRMCQVEADAKKLEIVLELWADQASVRGDATRLGQVFWNLLRNAIKFTPRGGRIAIQTHLQARDLTDFAVEAGFKAAAPQQVLPERDLLVEICDSGVGIEPEKIAGIFEAFEQGGREVTRAFGGLGLGLTISRALAQLHGGTVTAKSEGCERGSTFTVRLPLAASEQDARPPEKPAPREIRRRILLVEDHADTLMVTARLLSQCGYEVDTAATVAAAIQLARTRPFDLIVSDIGLPDGTGHDLIRQLVAEAPSHEMKGIAMSGFGQGDDLRESHEAGFLDHLVKPVAPEVLLHKVEEALGDSQNQPHHPAPN